MAFPTGWNSPLELQADNTKVSGSSNLTNFPALITGDNLSSAFFSSLAPVELNENYSGDSRVKAYYRFESGARTTDSSGNSHTLTAIHTPSYTTGVYGDCTSLASASTEYFTITNHADFRPTTAFAVSAWVKTSTSSYQTVFASYQQNTYIAGIQIQVRGNNGFASIILGKNTGTTQGLDYQRADGVTDLRDDEWHHVAGVWTGTYLKIYVDGKEENSIAWTGAPGYHANNAVRIGVVETVTGSTRSSYMDGEIDDLAFIVGSISSEEIAAIYRGGHSLRITSDSSGTTEIPFEIGSLNTTAETATIWVKIPTLDYNDNTSIYLWGGNDAALPYDRDDTYGLENVWNSNYKGVYHLNESGGVVYDSTANDHHSAAVCGTPEYGSPGKFGTSIYFDPLNDECLNFGNVSDYNFAAAFSTQAWIKTTQNDRYIGILGKVVTAGYILETQYGKLRLWINSTTQDSSASVNDGNWKSVVATRSAAGSLKMYINGSQDGSGTQADTTSNTGDFLIARNTPSYDFDGYIEEVRMSAVELSADWLATEHENQANPSTFWIPISSSRRIFIIS